MGRHLNNNDNNDNNIHNILILRDPAVQMKYHEALEQSFGMKVEDLQKELNSRGISTKYCMVLADFCIQYAKAIAENKPKTDQVQLGGEDDGDHDYDPSYRDVVMEPYDPNKFFGAAERNNDDDVTTKKGNSISTLILYQTHFSSTKLQ